ncbi:hypothetical protein IEQ34_001094 [Dendrobium chrysotoxum]|uniref:Uncharacterized protein n=1 Tax=Dendrobium chrysotoxum TaxID=161865 RepID=A0AAV7HLL9_DENCH|nr:hypothetical protein IEQ34_001094 [Dendrobium chrysotoxum]
MPTPKLTDVIAASRRTAHRFPHRILAAEKILFSAAPVISISVKSEKLCFSQKVRFLSVSMASSVLPFTRSQRGDSFIEKWTMML